MKDNKNIVIACIENKSIKKFSDISKKLKKDPDVLAACIKNKLIKNLDELTIKPKQLKISDFNLIVACIEEKLIKNLDELDVNLVLELTLKISTIHFNKQTLNELTSRSKKFTKVCIKNGLINDLSFFGRIIQEDLDVNLAFMNHLIKEDNKLNKLTFDVILNKLKIKKNKGCQLQNVQRIILIKKNQI